MNLTREMIAQLFRLKGGENGKVRLFENLSAPERADLTRRAALAPDEDLVITYFNSDAEWLLVTTRRLIWAEGVSQQSLSLLDLAAVEPDLRSAATQRSNDPESANHGWKLDIGKLHVETTDGRRATLTLQPGEPFFTLCNTLRRLCRWAEDWRAGRRW
jgi:hypothetical protein